MPEQALYLKWRPMSFDDMIGQEHITRALRNSLKTGRIRHAYLFSGPRGTGKTTSARLLAKAINCRSTDPDTRPCNVCTACVAVNEGRYMDLIEIDAATHTSVDDVRDLRDRIAFAPSEGKYKVYVIDEVHRFSGSAFDALLKTLEEPPDHAVFVLATTEIDKVPATIKSRCLPFEFRRVALQEVADRLQLIAESEGIRIERAALELIARQGTGSVRDSVSLLDQIVADPAEEITLDLAQRVLGTASPRAVKELVQALFAQDTAYGLHVINQAVDNGSDPRQFGQQVVEHLRSVLLAKTASADLIEASNEDRALFEEQAATIERGALLRAIRAFNEAVNTFKGGWQPQLSLELAFIESLKAVDLEPLPEQRPVSPRAQGTSASAQRALAADGEIPEVPEAQETAPGTPPVIPASVIRDRWSDLQRATHKLNSTLPSLLQHAHVRAVDGNRVILGVLNDVFREKLEQPDKRKALERGLHAVHGVPLKVQILLVKSVDQPVEAAPQKRSYDENDPVISLGLQLGGVIREDDKPE